eukprot:913860-Pyramimonas_sp.AAC.1
MIWSAVVVLPNDELMLSACPTCQRQTKVPTVSSSLCTMGSFYKKSYQYVDHRVVLPLVVCDGVLRGVSLGGPGRCKYMGVRWAIQYCIA